MEFLKSLNWVDLLLAVLAIRIVYSSVKAGFVTEFLKTFAVLIVVFLAFHYYTKLAVVLGHFVGLTQPVLEVLVFALIWVLGLVIMKFVRDGIFLIFTVQAISAVDRWGAAIVSIVRFCLTASMILFVFLLTDQPYMERMTKSSFAQKYVLVLAPETYQKMVNGFFAKLVPNQKVNAAVIEELNETGKK
jgi:uncharacterized membrane protein required for colicin V production